MNLPNTLTLLRIFFVPLLIVVLLTKSPNVEPWGFPMHFEVWGVLILLAAASTDWLDGFIARRRQQVTTLGILLDPIADKLLISTAFISLVDMHLAPAWMVVIIIGREFTVMGLRNIASAEGFTIAASTLGKTKMVLQVCAVAVLITAARHPSFKFPAKVLLWLVVISALTSAALTDDWAERQISLVARDFSTLPVAARTLVEHLRAPDGPAATEAPSAPTA